MLSVQVCSPVGLSGINDYGLLIISYCLWLLFEFYYLALWKRKLVNNVFISCCNEEEISLYIAEFMSLVFVVFVFYWEWRLAYFIHLYNYYPWVTVISRIKKFLVREFFAQEDRSKGGSHTPWQVSMAALSNWESKLSISPFPLAIGNSLTQWPEDRTWRRVEDYQKTPESTRAFCLMFGLPGYDQKHGLM